MSTDNNNKAESITDALFDAALAWTDVGLTHAKTSLVGSAKAMERTANALDVLRQKLASR